MRQSRCDRSFRSARRCGAGLVPYSSSLLNLTSWPACRSRSWSNPPPFLDFLEGRTGLDVMLYAILIIVVILFLPKGVFGTIKEKVTKR